MVIQRRPHCSATVAVVPLPGQDAALVVFGRRQVCELLSIEHFARLHGLDHRQ